MENHACERICTNLVQILSSILPVLVVAYIPSLFLVTRTIGTFFLSLVLLVTNVVLITYEWFPA